MTNILFHAENVRVSPSTSDGLKEIDFQTGDWDSEEVAVLLGDQVDQIAIVGDAEELFEVAARIRKAAIKLRQYKKSLAYAKTKLEGRLTS